MPHGVRLGQGRAAGGKRALRSVPKSGRPLKLERGHWKAVTRAILRSPTASGLDRDLRTLPLVGELIEQECCVKYYDDHLSRFVRRLGLSVQKPMVRERDEKAINRFIKAEFPAIEKTRAAAAAR